MAKPDKDKAKKELETLNSDLRSGRIHRVYLFHGEESYLVRRYLDLVAARVLSKGAETFDRVVFDGGGSPARIDLRRLAAEVATPPFLSPRKLIVVQNSGLFAPDRKSSDESPPDSATPPGEAGPDESAPPAPPAAPVSRSASTDAKDRGEALAEIVARVPDSACLVFLEKKVDRRMKKPIEAVEKAGLAVEFLYQSPGDLATWIARELREAGASIEASACDSLIARCGASMQEILHEVEKLRLYCAGSGTRSVSLALVEEVCVPDLGGSVFDMTDAIGQGDAGRALSILDALVSRKEPVQLLLYMLSRHVRNLIRAKEAGDRDRIVADLKVPPFVAGKLLQQARGIPMERLEELHGQCFEADAASKSGRMPDRLALETILASGGAVRRAAQRGRPD